MVILQPMGRGAHASGMGIAADLDYSFPQPNAFQRLMQQVASSRGGAWLLAKTLSHLDEALGRLSSGRQSIPGLFTGLPVVDVTTTGRKSGLRRTSHLIPIPISDSLALLGTNFGQPATPAWVLNLEADPRASVVFRGASVEVVARPATGAESEVVMANASGIYGGYAKYRQRAKGRSIRIFVLEPGGGGD